MLMLCKCYANANLMFEPCVNDKPKLVNFFVIQPLSFQKKRVRKNWEYWNYYPRRYVSEYALMFKRTVILWKIVKECTSSSFPFRLKSIPYLLFLLGQNVLPGRACSRTRFTGRQNKRVPQPFSQNGVEMILVLVYEKFTENFNMLIK